MKLESFKAFICLFGHVLIKMGVFILLYFNLFILLKINNNIIFLSWSGILLADPKLHLFFYKHMKNKHMDPLDLEKISTYEK